MFKELVSAVSNVCWTFSGFETLLNNPVHSIDSTSSRFNGQVTISVVSVLLLSSNWEKLYIYIYIYINFQEQQPPLSLQYHNEIYRIENIIN